MAACDFGMPVAQGRQSEALIRLGISIVADAKQGQLQEAHDGVRVPVDRDHRFRRKVITGSGGT